MAVLEEGSTMPVVDADTHVIETELTWDYMEGKDEQYRPKLLTMSDPGTAKRRSEFWFFDNMMENKRTLAPGNETFTTAETAEMRDLPGRLQRMDELGTDIHVLFPSVLLGMAQLARPQTQSAMCRAYNRWMADNWKQGGGRFRWVVVVPTQNIKESQEELEFGAANGACGMLTHGIMGDRTCVDPYFFPLYQKAGDLDLAVAFHSGVRNYQFDGLFHSRATTIWKAKFPVLGAFHSVVMGGLPDRFPKVRWGFLEAAASWVPYMLTDIGARVNRLKGRGLIADLMKKNRLYVQCQTEEDIPYILSFAGDDNIVCGTDYSHADTSSEVEALQVIGQREDISPDAKRKILDDNAKALYGI
jgi:predicted TIM-barrel fold metal-dependent hydrolase